MNLETKITIYKFTPQLFTLTLSKHSFGVLFGVPVCLQCQVHLLSK